MTPFLLCVLFHCFDFDAVFNDEVPNIDQD